MQTELIELNERAKEEGKKYGKKRLIFNSIKAYAGQRAFTAIVGPRGVGKTVLLKQLLCEAEKAFFISLDVGRLDAGLFDTAKDLAEKGVRIILIDEIHGYPGFEKELKKIYDFLPDVSVVFTSSSSLSLYRASVDLSRRVRVLVLPPFSFREFIYFEKEELPPPISLDNLLDEKAAREYYGDAIGYESLFERYMRGRNYPFTLNQADFLPLFKGILETIIDSDMVVKEGLQLDESFEVRKLLAFMGRSFAEGISYSSISENCGFSKFKAEKYVSLLEKSFVIRRVMPKGTNVKKEPKLLFSLPYRLLYKSYEDSIGALREDFFVDSIMNCGLPIYYLKSKRGEKTPDYIVQDTVFEVGGVSKGFSQFKGFESDKKILLTHPGTVSPIKRPLFFIGMMEGWG